MDIHKTELLIYCWCHLCHLNGSAKSKSQNAIFVVDINVVEFRDLKADDLDLWRGTGTNNTHFRLLPSDSIRYAECKRDASKSKEYLLLTC